MGNSGDVCGRWAAARALHPRLRPNRARWYLSNLRGFVETHRAEVIAITTLTESREAAKFALPPETLAILRERHGKALDILWQEQFGYGIDCLTEVEPQIQCREQYLACIEDFLAKAAVEARGRSLAAAVDPRL